MTHSQLGDTVLVKTDNRGAWVKGEVKTVIYTSPPKYDVQTYDHGLITYTQDVKMFN